MDGVAGVKLEIKDAESSTVYTIAHDGAVIGRERAKADIALKDEVISKRHARIFRQQGRWLLEDLGSSNGTYVLNKRISEPVELLDGLSFYLAQHRFEVSIPEDIESPTDDIAMNNTSEATLDIRASRMRKLLQEKIQETRVAPAKGITQPENFCVATILSLLQSFNDIYAKESNWIYSGCRWLTKYAYEQL